MKVRNSLLTLCFLLSTIFIMSSSKLLNLSQQTRRFVDTEGSEHILHGLNVVYKGYPWIPQVNQFDPYQSFSQKDMQYFKDWGLNVIRLGMMWPGVQPVKGQYNTTYIQQMVKLVNIAGQKYGIYTLLDMHQDILAARFCGEGIPQWAVRQRVPQWLDFPMPLKWPYPIPENSTYPPRSECGGLDWATGQFTLSTCAAYESLYDNYQGIGDAFNNFWVEVAKAFKGNEYVIGYQLINEPWAGNIYTAPWQLIPSVADRYRLQPFYDRAAEKIRQIDQEHIIFFESVTYDDFIPVGFSHAPGGADQGRKSSLSFHYYQPPNMQIENHFNTRKRDTQRLGCGSMLTQFDMNVGDAAVKTMNVADEHLISWMGWQYKSYVAITGYDSPFFDKDSNIMIPAVRQVSRTYAQVVSGKINSMRFNDTDSSFKLQYEVTSNQVGKETQVYYNKEIRYPNGIVYDIDGDAKVESDQKNMISIVAYKEGKIKFTLNQKK